MAAKMIRLTNKSTRVYTTTSGGEEIKFHPGTTKEFPEVEAIALLRYAGDIVKTIDTLGTDFKNEIKGYTDKISKQEAEIKELKSLVKEYEAEIKKLEDAVKDAKKDK